MAKVKLLKGCLKASSVLEVIISMVLIMVVFGIAMAIFTNVTRSSLSVQKIRAQALADEKIMQLERGNQDTASLSTDDMRIAVQITELPEQKGLKIAEVTVYSANREKIVVASKIIKAHD